MKLTGIKWSLWALFGFLLCGLIPVSAEEPSPLNSFPESSRLWMGLEEGFIRPAAYEQFRSSSAGYVSLQAKDGQMIAEDELWAIFDPEQIDLEKTSLELEEKKLEQLLKTKADDAAEAQLRLEVELYETEGKRQTLVDVSKDLDLPASLRNRAAESLSKIDKKIARLTELADPATLEKELALEESEGELNIARSRKEFLALEKRSQLIANFDGQIRFGDALIKAIDKQEEKDSLLWVESNVHLATIVNDDKYEIVVLAKTPLLSQIPRKSLLVYIQDSKTGRLIPGTYDRTEEVDTGSEVVRNYIFTIGKDSVKDAKHSSGQRGLIHVYRQFEAPFRLVQKKDIAFLSSQALAESGWNGLVSSLWPGSRVLQVGPQSIAVEQPE